MHAMVYREACIQCGLCPSLCPEVFSLEDGESAQAITGEIPLTHQAAAQAAANSCPVSAIHIS